MATRRAVLSGLALGLGVLAARGVVADPASAATYVGIETSARGQSRARFYSPTGAQLGMTPLDFRAHGMAAHGPLLVVFPRRPGTRFAVIDKVTLGVRGTVTAPPDRHFYGHGAFSQDGRHLIVTENDLTTLQGGLGIYDLSGPPRRLGTVRLPGPGPHEIVHVGKNTFLIALGGLETHPDYGRTPLNADSFRSGLVLYDHATGVAVAHDGLVPAQGVSLRHLAVDAFGTVYVGGQDQTASATRPVLYLWHRGAPRVPDLGPGLGGYVSSVAASGARALVSSKQSGRVITFDKGEPVATHALDGASAVAVAGGVDAMSGFQLLRLDGVAQGVTQGFEFDNHGLIY